MCKNREFALAKNTQLRTEVPKDIKGIGHNVFLFRESNICLKVSLFLNTV